MNNPNRRAWIASIGFALAGIISFIIVPSSRILWPETIFYTVLVINTFFSVRLFARVAPENWQQMFVDAALALSYLALAFSLGTEWAFPFFALCIFVAAPIKYALMLGAVPHSDLLRKKLLIDLSGTTLCILALLAAVFFDYPVAAAWTLAIIFSLANIYLLLVKPMYRL